MKRAHRIALSLALSIAATGCVPFCGSPCPPEPVQRFIDGGEYLSPRIYESSGISVFETGTDHRLFIDRENGAATLSFVDEQGRTIEIDYLSRLEGWRTVNR